ncbi:YidB family protein [Streptomyces spororaveus]|uniref:YidB family protein n=1 Tax=Streptomyces spororaveus TaxID=284039 RepID=UPI0036C565E8
MTDPVNDGTPAPTTLSISVKGLADAGLEPQLRSWVDSGPNEPVTAEQITQAVGKDELARTAESLGRDPGDLAADIVLALPQLIDMASPDGSAGLVQAKVNSVGELTVHYDTLATLNGAGQCLIVLTPADTAAETCLRRLMVDRAGTLGGPGLHPLPTAQARHPEVPGGSARPGPAPRRRPGRR